MDWLQMPTKNRRELIIYMERIKRPLRPTAGPLIPLTNAAFVSVINFLRVLLGKQIASLP